MQVLNLTFALDWLQYCVLYIFWDSRFIFINLPSNICVDFLIRIILRIKNITFLSHLQNVIELLWKLSLCNETYYFHDNYPCVWVILCNNVMWIVTHSRNVNPPYDIPRNYVLLTTQTCEYNGSIIFSAQPGSEWI